MYLYEIRNIRNQKIYVGITRTSLQRRWASHKYAYTKYKTPLYDAMKSFGFDCFTIDVVTKFESEEDLLEAERELVLYYKHLGLSYNVLDGGESYFPIKDKEDWKRKLSLARAGAKPALGMKHSEVNKKKFSELSQTYWSTQEVYSESILKLSFKEAHKQHGISRTHYYRLRKRIKDNDLN